MENPTPARGYGASNWASLSLSRLICKMGQITKAGFVNIKQANPDPKRPLDLCRKQLCRKRADRPKRQTQAASGRSPTTYVTGHLGGVACPESRVGQVRAWPRPPVLPPVRGSVPSGSQGGSWVRGWSERVLHFLHTPHTACCGDRGPLPHPLPCQPASRGRPALTWSLQPGDGLWEHPASMAPVGTGDTAGPVQAVGSGRPSLRAPGSLPRSPHRSQSQPPRTHHPNGREECGTMALGPPLLFGS